MLRSSSALPDPVALPPIPAKRYFTIGEVSELCGVKPHVLRYWEQEFTQLKPVKRRGNRRYYQHHEVLLVRRIRNCCTSRASPSAVLATSSRAGATADGAPSNRLPSRRRMPKLGANCSPYARY